jgi:hypothetical protein
VPQGIRPVILLGLSPVNLDSRISYRHGGRDPLPTDLVVTPPIKTLEGFDRDLVSNQKISIEINPTADPPPVRGTGGGATMGHGTARIHRRRGACEEEPPSAGADEHSLPSSPMSPATARTCSYEAPSTACTKVKHS